MVEPVIVRNVLTRTPVGTGWFIEQSCLFNFSEQIWWNKVVKVTQICFLVQCCARMVYCFIW